jgi:phosphoribosylformylglycinamidine synthase
MKFGVVIFPGSNCDNDLIKVLQTYTAQPVLKLWHKDTDTEGCTHIFIPGGFSYGDYLRSGALAKLSPMMQSVAQHAANGGFVLGICNGFQILCESGLLPGALLRNTNMKFNCKNVFLTPGNTDLVATQNIQDNQVLCVPIAHGEGRFYCDAETLKSIEDNGQVFFRYCDDQGNVTNESNPNGSINNIAGICNAGKNVFGMMPHPERCATDYLLNTDGKLVFDSFILGASVIA